MAGGSPERLQRDLTTLFQVGTAAGLTDRELIARISRASTDDAEALFEVLVTRHGPMVLRVCRNVLGDPHDAEDAFQATFLVLVKQFRTIRKLDSIGSWLYGVAARVSARARVEAAKRRKREREHVQLAVVPTPDDEASHGLAIQEEVLRLPDRYRSVVVLCYWEGLTHEQAAARLACPIGTIRSRVARARELLRRRLVRKGVAEVVAVPVLLPVPLALTQGTARIAAQTALGQSITHVAAACVADLSLYVARMMLMTKIGSIAAPAGLALVASIGLGLAAQTPKRAKVDAEAQPQPAKAAAKNLTRDRPAMNKRLEPKKDPHVLVTEAKLRETISVNFDKQPLSEAIAFIANYSGLNVVIDPKALADQGVTSSSPVTLNVSDVQLKTVLNLMLRPMGLACIPEDDVLLITTPQKNRPRAEHDNKFPVENSASTSRSNHPSPELKEYIVEPSDVLLVEVLEALPGRPIWGERVVRPDGKISLGFYGDVYVAGLTIQEAKEKIVLQMRKYLTDNVLGLGEEDPDTGKIVEPIDPKDSDRVSVDVTASNSKVYYVQGEVLEPGRLPITGKETILDAVNLVGGLTSKADHDGVVLIRNDPQGGPQKKFRIDIDEVLLGDDASSNFYLQAGDRLVVPRDPTAQKEPGDRPTDGRAVSPVKTKALAVREIGPSSNDSRTAPRRDQVKPQSLDGRLDAIEALLHRLVEKLDKP